MEIFIGLTNSGNWIDSGEPEWLSLLIQLQPLPELHRDRCPSGGHREIETRSCGADGITLNTVAPSFIPVERHAGEPVADYLATVPIGRMGTPADIAHTVSFLASDDAGIVTGQRIVVDGGRALT